VVATLFWATACAAAPSPSGLIASDAIADIIAKYREEIPQRMQQEDVAGLAVVVVDEHSILWAEGFGYTYKDSQMPITPTTLFSIQSMSKSFTATAVMFAVQDGLVDLDEPIATYLPDFHINSIFEEHPEKKITLRMLLGHTAGFAHEAPYGSNFDHRHTRSKTYCQYFRYLVKFPVGTRCNYSNLGIDLAGISPKYVLVCHSSNMYRRRCWIH
jgi:CubicO group peptidase (beta-lactamase class C family)